MALDFSKFGTPVDQQQDGALDFSKFGTPIDAPKKPEGGLLPSVARGFLQTSSLVTDILPGMIGKAVGAEEFAQRQFKEAAETEKKIQEKYAAAVPSYKDIKGVGDFFTYVTESVGELIPSIIPSLVTGGAAGIIGRGATIAAKEAAEAAARKGAAQGLTAEAIEQAAREAGIKAAQNTALKYQAVGAISGSALQNVPEVYKNVKDETGQDSIGTALLFGGFNSLLDAALPISLLAKARKAGIPNEQIVGEWYKRFGKGALKGYATEGATEAAQEMSSAAAEKFVDNNIEFFSEKNLERFINAGLKGGLGGGVVSGAMDVVTGRRPYTQDELVKDLREGETLEQGITRVQAELMASREALNELRQEQAESGRTRLNDEALRDLGLSKKDPIYQQILNKDINDPAQAAEVIAALNAGIADPAIKDRVKGIYANTIETIKGYAALGEQDVGASIGQAGGEGVGVAGVPSDVAPAEGVGQPQRVGIAPSLAATEQVDAGAGLQQPSLAATEAPAATAEPPAATAEPVEEEMPDIRTLIGQQEERVANLTNVFQGLLKEQINRFGLKDVALKVVDDLKNANGTYSKGLIQMAVDATDPVRDLKHESVHALKELGFFTDAQWNTLVNTAKSKWIDEFMRNRSVNGQPLQEGQQSRYDAYLNLYQQQGLDAAQIEENIIEEAIADAFGSFAATKPPPGLMSAILNRMRNFFSAIKGAVGMAKESDPDTAEAIFGKVAKGELKAPAAPEGKPKAPKEPEAAEEAPEVKTAPETEEAEKPAPEEVKPSLKREAIPGEMEISTQNPQAVGRKYDPITQMLSVDESAVREAMKDNPGLKSRILQAIKSYGFIPNGTSDKDAIEVFKANIVNNLLYLYRAVPPEIRNRSKLWYDGANLIASQMSIRYNLSPQQVAAIMAAMSPQKDWFQNVSMAERAIDILTYQGDATWTPDMLKYAESYVFETRDRKEREKRQAAFDNIKNTASTNIKLKDMSDEDAAAFIRAYDEAFNSRSYRIVTPEGGFADLVRNNDGNPSTLMWSTYDPIEKSVSIFRDGSRENISQQLGFEHKIRSFYNNIIAPNSELDHVTIDTHAVGAGLFEALAGTDPEVSDNFGATGKSDVIGIGGTYGIIADAYRQAAKEVGIKPREMQSITWEAIRALFSEEMKKAIKPMIRQEWNKYKTGQQSFEDTRQNVLEIATKYSGPGKQIEFDNRLVDIPLPDWVGGGRGMTVEEGGHSYDKSYVPEGGVRLRQYNELREKMTFNLSSVTSSIPGLKTLYERAMRGKQDAYEVLQKVAESSLNHYLSGTGARVKVEYAKGVFLSDREPSISVSVSFDERNSSAVLSALAQFADNYNQQQIHVRVPTAQKLGHVFDDGSYATAVYEIDLRKNLSNNEISNVINSTGLQGFTITDKLLTAYWLGPTDATIEQQKEDFNAFATSIKAVNGLVGERGTKPRRRIERLYVYGTGFGARIDYSRIRSDVRPERTADTKTPKIIAEYLTGAPVTTFKQKELTAAQKKDQEVLARVFEELPLNDLNRPIVRKAYDALSKALLDQYKVLPIKIELVDSTQEPYKNSAEMRRDVSENNRFRVYKTQPETFGPPGSNFKNHPLLKDSGLKDINGQPMLFNDLLRAVHDYLAHNLTEAQFGPAGEAAAWRNHMATTPDPMARWALTSETRLQNAWQNFRKGVQDLTLMQRGFAEQKAVLAPINFALTGDRAVDQPVYNLIKTLSGEQRLGSLPQTSSEAKELKKTIQKLVDQKPKAPAQAKPSLRAPDTQEFKQFIAGSKAVDENGRPLVFYHGSLRDKTVFRGKVAGAIFLAPDPSFAEGYIQYKIKELAERPGQYLSKEEVRAAVRQLRQYVYDNYGRQSKAAKDFLYEITEIEDIGKKTGKYNFRGELGDAWRGNESQIGIIEQQMLTGRNITPVYVNVQRPFDYEKRSDINAIIRKMADRQFMQTVYTPPKKYKRVGKALIPVGESEKLKLVRDDEYPEAIKFYEARYLDKLKSGDFTTIESPEVVQAIKDAGFDGFYVKEEHTSGPAKNLAVFSSNQIKSAIGNVGTYGQRLPTDTELERLGMSPQEAAKAQAEGDIRFSLREKGQPATRENVVASMKVAQEQNSFMNCQLAVQMATGVPNLRDLPKVSEAQVGDIYTFNETKNMASHYAIDVGDGMVAEVEEWGAPVRVVPLEEVMDEYDKPSAIRRPPDTAYTAEAQKVKRTVAKPSLRAPDTPEFKRWFGDSKVVDSDGKPLVMYHGTYNIVEESGITVPKTRGNRNAFFVSPDANFANKYALNDLDWYPEKGFKKVQEGAQVYPVYISAKNPFDYENNNHVLKIIPQFRNVLKEEEGLNRAQIEELIDDFRDGKWLAVELANDYDLFEKNGFDAFYTKEQGRKNLGVFKPQQVKSAIGNFGTYSAEKPDIRYSLRAPNTPQFKQWFGDSKVVDAEGKPLVVYHASTKFDGYEFKKSPKVNRTGNPDGYYFSSSPSDAADYVRDLDYIADRIQRPEKYDRNAPVLYAQGAEIIPAYLRIEKPYDYKAKIRPNREMILQYEKELREDNPRLGDDWVNEKLETFKEGRWPNISFPTEAMTRVIKAGGYDGMKDGRHWIAFDSNQIKSAIGNRGTFEVESPDIRFSLKSKDLDEFATLVEDGLNVEYPSVGKALFKYTQDGNIKGITEAVNEFEYSDYRDALHRLLRTMFPSGVIPVRHLKDYAGFKDSGTGPMSVSINPDFGKGSEAAGKQVQTFNVNVNDVIAAGYGPESELIIERIKPSLRSQLPASTVARIEQTTTARKEEGFIERITSAFKDPNARSKARAEALNRYNRFGEYDTIKLGRSGGMDLYADVTAEGAALMSDLGAGVLASAFGVHDRVGGVPVYKRQFIVQKMASNGMFTQVGNALPSRAQAEQVAKRFGGEVRETGYTAVSNLNDTVKGPLAIFAPLMEKYKDPEIFRIYQFWAGVKRGSKYMAVPQPGGGFKVEEKNFTPADIAKAQDLERRFPEFVDVQKEWIKYNNGLVKYMLDTGVISKAQAIEFTKHGDYFPFYRQAEDSADAIGPRVFQSIAGVQAPRKIKHGEDPLGDFFENMVRNSQAAIQAGLKNVAARRAADVGMDVGTVQRLPGSATGANVFYVMENGEKVYYDSSDILFVEAMKSLGLPNVPFIGLLAAPANILRNLVTKDPGFMLANMMRDSLSAWATSGVKMTPMVATLANFGKAVAGSSPELDAMYKSGILGGYDYSQNVMDSAKEFKSQIRKQSGVLTKGEKALRPATWLWEALEKGTSASDAATRIEVYKDTLARTGNEAEALFRSLEVMNFNRKGANPIIRIATAAIPFLNARMQGLDVLYRAGFGANATKNAKEIQRNFFIRGMTMAALSSLYWLLTHDDDEYKKQEQEVRDNNWLFPSLGIRIPIPFEVGVLFKVIPERILGLTFGQDTAKDFTQSMIRQATSTFGLNPIPQAALPIVESMTNYSFFTGRPIVSKGLEDVAPAYQVGPGTSRLAEELGAATKGLPSYLQISPVKLDQLINGYTGTMGMYMVNIMDSIYDLNSDRPKPSMRVEQYPVIKRFILDKEARGQVSAYYDLKNSVDTATRTSNLLERTGRAEEYGPYIRDNAKMLATKEYVLDMYKTLRDLNEMKVVVRTSKMDADRKRATLDSIQRAENNLTAKIQDLKKKMQ